MFRAPGFSFTSIAQITETLFLCGAAAVTPENLRAYRFSTVINCTQEVAINPIQGVEYIRIYVDDVPTARIDYHFDRCADKIHEVRLRGGRILVHCAAGVSRSASLCIAYLMKYHSMTLRDAYRHVKMKRPVIRPNVGFFKQLITYEQILFNNTTVHIINSPIGPIPDVYENEVRGMLWMHR